MRLVSNIIIFSLSVVQGLPLLKRGMINGIIDPQLLDKCVKWEVDAMMHAAELCLSPLPEQRPRMSQVSFNTTRSL